jgi:hypothetical protein
VTRRIGIAVLAASALLSGGACRHRSRTPDDAFSRLQSAVSARDPGALFDALDQGSRWAWMTVQKSHREAYDIILSNYPDGAEKDRERRRFERGATLGSARELFIEQVGRADLETLPNPLPAATRFDVGVDAKDAVATLASGLRLRFRLGADGGWGYAGFAEDADNRQVRALHDVDLVRVNAADYERAAARSAR